MSEQNFLPENFKPVLSCLTINTDASFCGTTKAGGFAFYIICDNFKIKKAGKFSGLSDNATQAEIKALANAFLHLINEKDLPQLRTIIINTDSQDAIKYISTGTKNAESMQAHKLLSKVMALSGCQDCRFRWVKSHTNANNRRSHVNAWCDEEAKKHMRQYRKELQTKTNKNKNNE